MDNVKFLAVSLAITGLIFLLSALYQKYRMPERRDLTKAKRIAYISLFSALAALLMLIEIPLPFAPSFYKLDLGEIPALFCGFYLGPLAGAVCELFKVLLHLLLKGTTTAFVGDFSNFLIGCTFVLPAAVLYHRHKTKKTAVAGLLAGTLIMTAFGSFFNGVYLIPKFAELYGLPLEQILAMGTAVNPAIQSIPTLVVFAVVPFNLLKGIVVSILTFLLYKRMEKLLNR